MQLTREMFRKNALEPDTNTYLRTETDAFIEMLRAAKRAREASFSS